MITAARFQGWLIKTRKARELTYKKLAELSGVSTANINSIELGYSCPTLDTVEKLCNALGVSVESAIRVRRKPNLASCYEPTITIDTRPTDN